MADLSVVGSPDATDMNVPLPGEFVDFPDSPFHLFMPYPPAGDQPTAISQLVEGVQDGLTYQTLLGVTGSGKTFIAVHLLKTMYQILITGTLHIVQIDLIGLACQLNGNENTAHVS